MAETELPGAGAGPIVVYGATGYTGRLIARELTQRGARVTLAGRSRERLEAVAEDVGGDPAVAAVPLDDAAGLRELIGDAAVVIGCAGPFTLHGEPVIAAAAETGTNYLDTTGEQPFIRGFVRALGRPRRGQRRRAGQRVRLRLRPGRHARRADRRRPRVAGVDDGRLLGPGFGATRGTSLSALEMIRGGDAVWRGGELHTAGRSVDEGRFAFPSPIGSQRVGRYPAGEVITVPRHVDVGSMRTVIELRSLIGVPLGPLAAPAMAASGLAMSTPLRGAIGRLIARLPEGPPEDARKAARFTIVCDAEHAGGSRRGIARGTDVYGLTAFTIAEGATQDGDAGLRAAPAPSPPRRRSTPRTSCARSSRIGVWTEVEPL